MTSNNAMQSPADVAAAKKPHINGAFSSPSLAIFRLTQGLIILMLGLWIGSAVMAGISAGVTFKTVREHRVSIGNEPYNHPLVAPDASDIVAGAVAHRIFYIMEFLGLFCGTVALLLIAMQAVACRKQLHKGVTSASFNLRWLAIIGAFALYALLVAHMSPTIWELRNTEYDITETPEARQAAKAEIDDFYHPWSERAVLGAVALIGVAIIVTPFNAARPDAQ